MGLFVIRGTAVQHTLEVSEPLASLSRLKSTIKSKCGLKSYHILDSVSTNYSLHVMFYLVNILDLNLLRRNLNQSQMFFTLSLISFISLNYLSIKGCGFFTNCWHHPEKPFQSRLPHWSLITTPSLSLLICPRMLFVFTPWHQDLLANHVTVVLLFLTEAPYSEAPTLFGYDLDPSDEPQPRHDPLSFNGSPPSSPRLRSKSRSSRDTQSSGSLESSLSVSYWVDPTNVTAEFTKNKLMAFNKRIYCILAIDRLMFTVRGHPEKWKKLHPQDRLCEIICLLYKAQEQQ